MPEQFPSCELPSIPRFEVRHSQPQIKSTKTSLSEKGTEIGREKKSTGDWNSTTRTIKALDAPLGTGGKKRMKRKNIVCQEKKERRKP
jgi:hypothetical protein